MNRRRYALLSVGVFVGLAGCPTSTPATGRSDAVVAPTGTPGVAPVPGEPGPRDANAGPAETRPTARSTDETPSE